MSPIPTKFVPFWRAICGSVLWEARAWSGWISWNHFVAGAQLVEILLTRGQFHRMALSKLPLDIQARKLYCHVKESLFFNMKTRSTLFNNYITDKIWAWHKVDIDIDYFQILHIDIAYFQNHPSILFLNSPYLYRYRYL